MTQPRARPVLLLDDDEDLLDALSSFFEGLGATCLKAQSVDELVAIGDAALRCRLAVLDINLGATNPTGLDAFAWLNARGFSGSVVFVTGHVRSHPLAATARALGAPVLEKPVPVSELEALLEDGENAL